MLMLSTDEITMIFANAYTVDFVFTERNYDR